MAERALPAASASRTVTVRVRSLVIAVAVVAALTTVVWSLRWVTGLQPISLGNSSVLTISATAVPGPHWGPTVYRVGGDHPRFILTFGVHNSASVPVTVTGVSSVGVGGPIAGPTLQPASSRTLEPLPGPFHAVRIPADGTRALTLVYRIESDFPCRRLITVPEVVLRFTTLGVFDESQRVSLGDQAVSVTGRC